jgi:hypothetical protein
VDDRPRCHHAGDPESDLEQLDERLAGAGLRDHGTTPEEARAGESLDLKLGREVPEPNLDAADERADASASPVDVESFDDDAVSAGVDAVDEETVLDVAAVQPNRDSPVSMYDTGIDGRTVLSAASSSRTRAPARIPSRTRSPSTPARPAAVPAPRSRRCTRCPSADPASGRLGWRA